MIKNVLKEYIEAPLNVTRFFITHNDLDADGCEMLHRLLIRDNMHFYNNTISRVMQPSKLVTVIKDLLVEYDVHDAVFLITDLAVSRSQYDEIAKIMSDFNSTFAIIDHHQQTLQVEAQPNVTVVSEFPGECATTLFRKCIKMYNDTVLTDPGAVDGIIQTIRRNRCIYTCICIGRYDTGMYNISEDDEKTGIMLNLLHDHFEARGGNFVDVLTEHVIGISGLREDCATACIPSRLLSIAEAALNKMQIDYTVFSNSIAEVGTAGVAFTTHYPKGQFSVLSQWWLNAHPVMKALVAYDSEHDAVSMRTVRDDVDLSAIAAKFNGGGHKKAAGFPFERFSFTDLTMLCLKYF